MMISAVLATLPGDYTIQLRSRGIEAHKFNKVIPRLTVAYNNRDHRKILVIDGQVAYTGGINLADEYINHVERFWLLEGQWDSLRWSWCQGSNPSLFDDLVYQSWGNQRF